jgi:uncharacterized protein (TIRG00374 family)
VNPLLKILRSKWLRFSLGIMISLGALYLALRGVDLQLVWDSIQHAEWGFILLALLCIAMNTLSKTIRWKVLVSIPGQNIQLSQYLMTLLAGQLLNTIFPARLGDLARAYSLGGKGPGRSYVLGTIVLEKMLDSIAYILLFTGLIILIPLPDWVGGSILVFLFMTVIIIGGIIILVFIPGPFKRYLNSLLGRFPDRWRLWLAPRIDQGLESLEIIRHRNDLLRLTFWTAVIWIMAVVTNYFTLLALDIHLPIAASMLILFGLQAGISLPAIPGTIGLFEYICVLALAYFGIDQATALSFGLLLHAIVLAPSMVAGTLSFWILGLSGQREKFQDTSSQLGKSQPYG